VLTGVWKAASRAGVRGVAVAALSLFGAGGASAQSAPVSRGDALLRSGRLRDAERAYYTAVRRAPRDAEARLALGRYLAARGALKVGAVLMEEARYFGGDARVIAVQLAPVYQRLGAFGSLVTLPQSPLSYPERMRAEWLRDNPPSTSGPDSVDVELRPGDSRGFGRLLLQIGADSVLAQIDPRTEGLVLDTSWTTKAGVKTFSSRGDRASARLPAVALAVRVGAMTLNNLLTRFEPQRSHGVATIGLDALSSLTPSFSSDGDHVRLRRDTTVSVIGDTIPTLAMGPELQLAVADTLILPIGHPDALSRLQGKMWTLVAKRGMIVVAP
jgi:hypothetical protein